MNQESQTIEFKENYTDDIKKTVVAFANTDGGTIYIGIDDDGNIVGVNDPDKTVLRAQNAFRDAIKPDITMHLSCVAKKMDNKNVVVVEVQRGTACPYYLADKGIRPAGVYVRQGPSSVPASEAAILKMIKDFSAGSYEDTCSLNQDLTFKATKAAFKDAGIAFDEQKQRTLGLITQDGAFTNLAFLLSDQCSHTIKLAVFQGTSKSVFRDRYELTGSMLAQLNESFDYICRYNHIRSEFNGLKRIDMPDYPQAAIREALLNTIVHRDYSLSGPSLISIFDNRIEFVSLGGLVRGLAEDDLMLGVSVPRNKRLAEVFYRLELIEAYGTGIPKIYESYENSETKPIIQITSNAFKITLPNLNQKKDEERSLSQLTSTEQKAFQLFDSDTVIKRKDIEEALGVSQTTTIKTLARLIEQGLVVREGSGKNTRYYRGKLQ